MQLFARALCFWVLSTLPLQVHSVHMQYNVDGSGDVFKVASNTRIRNDPVNLDFGGKQHGVDMQGDETRPEVLKMQVCEKPSSKCSECTTRTSCWRGSDGEGLGGKIDKGSRERRASLLMLDVAASSTANYYAVEMWASCGSGKGLWSAVVWRKELVNGLLKFFLDGSEKRTSRLSKGGVKAYVVFAIKKDSRVRVLFERLKAGHKASAVVKLKARRVDAYTDLCMGVTNCLASLGDGSASAFEFRNSNMKQLDCLAASARHQRDAVSDHCNIWRQCVSESGMTSKLKALLGAALVPRGSLAEGRINTQKLNDAEGCVDPSVEDPESWECECMDEMTALCKGVNEECFHGILCKSNNVCKSWKDVHCAVGKAHGKSLLANQMVLERIEPFNQSQSALMQRSLTSTENAIGLDTAVQGKCTSAKRL